MLNEFFQRVCKIFHMFLNIPTAFILLTLLFQFFPCLSSPMMPQSNRQYLKNAWWKTFSCNTSLVYIPLVVCELLQKSLRVVTRILQQCQYITSAVRKGFLARVKIPMISVPFREMLFFKSVAFQPLHHCQNLLRTQATS